MIITKSVYTFEIIMSKETKMRAQEKEEQIIVKQGRVILEKKVWQLHKDDTQSSSNQLKLNIKPAVTPSFK